MTDDEFRACDGCPLSEKQIAALKRTADERLAWELVQVRIAVWKDRAKIWGWLAGLFLVVHYFLGERVKEILSRWFV